MTDHLCLKWNNHSSSFLKYISKIQIDEKFCDATIACQGKYFPVHRIVLSTCSDYFDEIFDRMVSPHPYIIFKDIESREMNLLLTYMYKGEVNVTQDMLPSLIKAAEALRIKGLAVPDEEAENKRRKSKSDESKRRKCSDLVRENETNTQDESLTNKSTNSESTLYENASKHQLPINEVMHVKEEPLDVSEYGSISDGELDKFPAPSVNIEQQKDFSEYSSTEETLGIKSEEIFDTNSFEDRSLESTWTNMDDVHDIQTTLSSERISSQNDMYDRIKLQSPNSHTNPQFPCEISQRKEDCSAISHPGCSDQTRSSIPYRCPFCDYRNRWRSKINRHMLFKHSDQRPYSCSYCSKRFVEKTAQKRHMRMHTGEKPFECQLCSKKFRHNILGKNCEQRDLAYECIPEDHPGAYLIMNLPKKLKIKCSFCDYENYKKSHVRTHEMQKHTGERPFPCPTCFKKFVKKNDLERHIRVHTGEKPYNCHWCGSKFSLKGNLRHHMLKKTCRHVQR